MSDALRDELRELAQDIPWDRPDAARRDALRSSLLIAAAETPNKKARAGRDPEQRRWLVVGAAFAAGALAAAAVALIVVRRGSDARSGEPQQISYAGGAAQITTTAASRIEHKVVATATGVDEIVRVLDGTVRLTVDDVRAGDHVRVRTRDAEVEGAGDYEVVVASETLSAVTVRSGTAQVRVDGQRAVFLSAGQTWRAAIVTDDLSPKPTKVAAADSVTTAPDIAPARPDVAMPDEPAPRSEAKPARADGAVKPDTVVPARAEGAATPDPTTVVPARPDVATPAKQDVPLAPPKPDAATIPPVKPDATSPAKPDAANATRVDAPVLPEPTQFPKLDPVKPDTTISTGSASVAATQKKVKSETERRFEAGWKLLRDGKAREAAVELAAAADASPDDALAADARYFQAVALVRSGQGREAERVLVAFLDQALKSLRRGRAAVLLGRLLAERGDVESARAWYKSAVDDPDGGVAAAARAGLDALPPKR